MEEECPFFLHSTPPPSAPSSPRTQPHEREYDRPRHFLKTLKTQAPVTTHKKRQNEVGLESLGARGRARPGASKRVVHGSPMPTTTTTTTTAYYYYYYDY